MQKCIHHPGIRDWNPGLDLSKKVLHLGVLNNWFYSKTVLSVWTVHTLIKKIQATTLCTHQGGHFAVAIL